MDYYKMKVDATNFIREQLLDGVPESVIKYKLMVQFGFGEGFYKKVIKMIEDMQRDAREPRKKVKSIKNDTDNNE